MINYGTNEGYAIEMLERTFYHVGLMLAEGDPTQIHFSFAHWSRGNSKVLPKGFNNLLRFSFREPERSDYEKLAGYVKNNGIKFTLVLDLQPTHTICRYLREGGVRTIVSYWGSPISPLMPRWKLVIKKLGILFDKSKVDGLIFESTRLAEFALKGRGVPEGMIDIVPTGVDTSHFCPTISEYVYEQFGFSPDRRVCVFSGHVYEGKGINVLIDAAIILLKEKRRDDVCFLLCGNRTGENNEFEERYSGLGLDEYIRFGGYRDDMHRIYPGCFCGVVPSLVEDSFPSSALEMAACGLPVVASRIGGLTDSVIDGETGFLFKPGDATQLARIIEKMLDDPSIAEEYGLKGHRRCELEFSTGMHRKKLEAVFRKRIRQSTRT
jgi:glycosyltransferase involved in cell wall biosynthesis